LPPGYILDNTEKQSFAHCFLKAEWSQLLLVKNYHKWMAHAIVPIGADEIAKAKRMHPGL
jgi:hypothetical protein